MTFHCSLLTSLYRKPVLADTPTSPKANFALLVMTVH